MVPQTFFADLAKRMPFVMFHNRLYQLDDRPSDENFLIIGNQHFGLTPSAYLEELEHLYRELKANEIFEFKKQFIESRISKEMKPSEELNKLTQNSKIVHFIFYELFPLYNETDDDIDALLAGEDVGEDDTRKNIDALIDEEFGTYDVTIRDIQSLKAELLEGLGVHEAKDILQIQQQEEFDDEDEDDLDDMLQDYYQKKGVIQREQKISQILQQKQGSQQHKKTDKISQLIQKHKGGEGLETVLQGSPIFVFHDKVYQLEVNKNPESSEIIVLNNTTCTLKLLSNLNTIEDAFKQYFAKQFKIEAVEEFEEQLLEIQKIRARNKRLGEFANKESYEMGNVGYLKRGGNFFFYIKVPKFAMRHPDPSQDIYYKFEKCRVALRLHCNNDKVHSHPNPVVIESYPHPFLSGSSERNHICLGRYKYHEGKTPEEIKKVLSDAVNVIINGYTKNCNPYNSITDFRTIPLDEAKEKGYQITNLHGGKRK